MSFAPYPVDYPPQPATPSTFQGTFTYDPNTNYPLFIVRALIPDTDITHPIFNDDELNAFLFLESSQGIYQSNQANPTGSNVPSPVFQYDYRRAAATAIDSIASSKARLAVIEKVLDVTLNAAAVQKALHAQAESLREQSDNSGRVYAIAEIVYDAASARERTRNQWLRLLGP